MKVAIIERQDGKKFEIENVDVDKFMSNFDSVSEKDNYDGFTATKGEEKFYIVIVNY